MGKKRNNQKGKKRQIIQRTENAGGRGTPPLKYFHSLNSPITIYDYRSRKCVYVNKRFCELTGISAEQCYRERLEEFTSWIHPPDLAILQKPVAERLMQVCRSVVESDDTQLTYTINFRLKEKNGVLPHVLAQCTILEWDQNKLPAVAINMLTDVTNHKKDQKMIFTVSVFNSDSDRWETELTEEFLRNPAILSRRETEIMRLMMLGKNLDMISKMLNISYNTVRTHCQNILDKAGCPSQACLKELAVKEGWV